MKMGCCLHACLLYILVHSYHICLEISSQRMSSEKLLRQVYKFPALMPSHAHACPFSCSQVQLCIARHDVSRRMHIPTDMHMHVVYFWVDVANCEHAACSLFRCCWHHLSYLSVCACSVALNHAALCMSCMCNNGIPC